MGRRFTFEQVMSSVDTGLQARDEINKKTPPEEPFFEYGIIVCAMRFFTASFSEYYRDFAAVHTYSTPQEIIQLASLELSKAAVKLSQESGYSARRIRSSRE